MVEELFLTYKINKATKIQQQNLFNAILTGTTIEEPKHNTIQQVYTIKTSNIACTPTTIHQTNLAKFFNDNVEVFKQYATNQEKNYNHFRIPKRNGKWRDINEPNPELKRLLTYLKDKLQDDFSILTHNAAYAYTKNRSTLDMLQKHQQNESKWFLKLDIKDFFPSCTEAFIHQQLKQIYPLNICYKAQHQKDEEPSIMYAIRAAMLNGGLPQGSPFSPYLTNLIMLPIDYEIYNFCKQWNKQHFVYTRYADDIIISSKYDFDFKTLLKEIEALVTAQAPFQFNPEKVRYGSTSGRNWNLGLMINNNGITIGYRKKREIKEKLHNFCTNKENWTKDDIQAFHGQLSYFLHIEPEYAKHVLNEYSKKYNNKQNILLEMRQIL